MKRLFFVVSVLVGLSGSIVLAQRPNGKTQPKPKVNKTIVKSTPLLADYQYQCAINAREQVSCVIASPEKGGYLDVEHIGGAMRAVFAVGTDRMFEELIFPKVVIEADNSLKMETLLDLLIKFRVSENQVVEYKLATGISLFLPPMPDRRREAPVFPNPLKLQVDITKGGSLTLNSDPAGSLNEPMQLTKELIRIFREREANGVFRPGENEIEKTVSIVMPLDGYGIPELQKIAEAISLAGGDRIVLDIDAHYYPKVPSSLLGLPPISPKRRP